MIPHFRLVFFGDGFWELYHLLKIPRSLYFLEIRYIPSLCFRRMDLIGGLGVRLGDSCIGMRIMRGMIDEWMVTYLDATFCLREIR